MSYDIVRSVKVADDGTVTIKSASNNVYPRTASEWQMTYRHEANPFTGKLGAEVEVFAGYEQGNFQGGSNKFTRQLEVLRNMPEYAQFDWRGSGFENRANRENKQAYYQLLATALATPAPKEKFVITKMAYGSLTQKVYGRYRKGGRAIYWETNPSKATKHNFAAAAERMKECFYNSDNWQIEQI